MKLQSQFASIISLFYVIFLFCTIKNTSELQRISLFSFSWGKFFLLSFILFFFVCVYHFIILFYLFFFFFLFLYYLFNEVMDYLNVKLNLSLFERRRRDEKFFFPTLHVANAKAKHLKSFLLFFFCTPFDCLTTNTIFFCTSHSLACNMKVPMNDSFGRKNFHAFLLSTLSLSLSPHRNNFSINFYLRNCVFFSL